MNALNNCYQLQLMIAKLTEYCQHFPLFYYCHHFEINLAATIPKIFVSLDYQLIAFQLCFLRDRRDLLHGKIAKDSLQEEKRVMNSVNVAVVQAIIIEGQKETILVSLA